MRALAFVVSICAPLACASAPIEQLWANDTWPACSIEIEFLSRCCGIDRNAYERVASYVEKSNAVSAAFSKPWGASGETTLCLVIGDFDRTRVVFEDLTILVPARGRKLPRLTPPPPVVLRLNGGDATKSTIERDTK